MGAFFLLSTDFGMYVYMWIYESVCHIYSIYILPLTNVSHVVLSTQTFKKNVCRR